MRLECPYCPGEDYHHLATTITFTDDDNYKMVRCGEIPHVRAGKRILFHRSVLERWLSGESLVTNHKP